MFTGHSTPNSATDDTDEDHDIGGAGYYSHGSLCLQHHHWPMQVISAGGFNVHCTQSAEASHRLNAKLASLRVRHLHPNKTQSSMLQYMLNYNLFEELKSQFPTLRPPVTTRRIQSGVFVPLVTIDVGGHANPVRMHTTSRFTSASFQSSLLHREARITRVELMDLLCDKLGLPKTLPSFRILEKLQYSFGQKLVRLDGEIFWSTDTQYPYDSRCSLRCRRDIVRIKGSERKTYITDSGRGPTIVQNAFCAETVLFLTVHNIDVIPNLRANQDVQESRVGATLTFCLVRYFEPHNTLDRDSQHRPICPGPLYLNHCLWRYARTSADRRVLITPAGEPTAAFLRQKYIFGRSEQEYLNNLLQERRSYFGLIFPNNILETVHMCPVFHPGTCVPDTREWLQSVTII